MSHDYPVGFSFKLFFTGTLGLSDTSFKEVSGIKSKMDTEDLREGGENNFVHKLPTGVSTEALVLQRGVAPNNSPLVIWCQKVLEGGLGSAIVPMPMGLYLLDENQLPTRIWTFYNAWPSAWEMDSFSASKSDIAIEKITINYSNQIRVL